MQQEWFSVVWLFRHCAPIHDSSDFGHHRNFQITGGFNFKHFQEKNAYESYNSDVNKKSAEMERLRNIIERDREEVERLAIEKQSYEDRISTMTREKEMLEETFKTLDTKVAHMRR